MNTTPPPENERHARQIGAEQAQFADQLNAALVQAQARAEAAQNALPTPRATPPGTPPFQGAVGAVQPDGTGLHTPPPTPPGNRFQRTPTPRGARTPER